MVDRAKVRQVLASVLEVDAAAIEGNPSMDTIAGSDSQRRMNLVLAPEESFAVSMPDGGDANATPYRPLVLDAPLAA